MPTLSITKSYADGDILLEADLDNIITDVQNFMNTTKIDDDNIQDSGIGPNKLDSTAVDGTTVTINGSGKLEAVALSQGVTGEVKMFHTFNATLSVPRGWMVLDGDVVNQTNYDALHGSGAYAADGIASSAILNKNLPDMTGNIYATGAAATSQDGTSPITTVGVSGSQVNLQHSHTVNSHNHQWYDHDDNNTANSYNSGGTSTNVEYTGWSSEVGSKKILAGEVTDGVTYTFNNGTPGDDMTIGPLRLSTSDGMYTSNASPGTNNQLSATQSIKPESVEFIYIMKVI